MTRAPPLIVSARAGASAANLPLLSGIVGAILMLSGWTNAALWHGGVIVTVVDVAVGGVLVVLGIAMRARPIPVAMAHPTAAMLMLATTAPVVGVVLGSTDPDGAAYFGMLLIFTGLLFLSWPWFVFTELVIGLIYVGTWALGAPGFGIAHDPILVVSGMAGGASAHAVRIRMFDRMARSAATARVARREAERERAHLSTLFSSSPIGVLTVDLKSGLIVDANPAITRMIGHSVEELRTKRPQDVIVPEERAEVDGVIAALRARSQRESEALRHMITKSGDRILVQVRSVVVPGRDGDGLLNVAFVEDVTTKQEAADQLRVQAALLASVSQAVIATDLSGVLTYANHAAEKMFGWSAAELAGRPIESLLSTSERDEVVGKLVSFLASGDTWRGDLPAQRRDATPMTIALAASPVIGENGGLVGLIGVCEDVTEIRRTEAALRRSERDAALGTLVAGVAHEINNPLQFIVGNMDLTEMDIEELQADASLPAAVRDRLKAMSEEIMNARRGVEQVARIASSLRQVARRSDGPRRPIDINAVMDSVIATAQPRFGPSVRLIPQLESRAQPLANAGEITQVLLNLMLNAADAMGEEGTLRIRTRDADGECVIEVEDTGPGVPPELMKRLFTPFFTTKPTGTGLGLSISRRIVEDHGGTLSCQSEPGRTVFRVALPTAPTPRAAASARQA